jgi:DNA-binding protein HU-beta/integration host factor subunit beta
VGAAGVTKKDIVRTISEELGLTQQQTKSIVQKTFDAIIQSLVLERRVELRNFGVFEVKQRSARRARNPRTGNQVEVPEKLVVTFKPGKVMEARVKKLNDEALAKRRAAVRDLDLRSHSSPTGIVTPANSGDLGDHQ